MQPQPQPRPRRRRWPWYAGGTAIVAAGAVTAAVVLTGGARDLPSLRASLLPESAFFDTATVETSVEADVPATDAGLGIGRGLDLGESESDPPECAELLDAEADLAVEAVDVARASAPVGDGVTYTQTVVRLPGPATDLVSLDPLHQAIDACGTVELTGDADGEAAVADAGLPAAGDDSVSLTHRVDTDDVDRTLALAAVLYDDRILLVTAVTPSESLGGVDADEMAEHLADGLGDFYAEALERAGV